MNKDYTYCISDNCIHRRGCKRNLINYTEQEVKELYTENRFILEVDYNKCIPNLKDINCENNYGLLDRFRYSDGTPLKTNS